MVGLSEVILVGLNPTQFAMRARDMYCLLATAPGMGGPRMMMGGSEFACACVTCLAAFSIDCCCDLYMWRAIATCALCLVYKDMFNALTHSLTH